MNLNWTTRTKRRLVPLALAFTFAAPLLLTPAASAAAAETTTTPAPAPVAEAGAVADTTGADIAARTCYVSPKRTGVDAVSVRTQPYTTATRIGIMYKGQRAVASCTATAGGRYTACGGTSNYWIRVTWSGRTGYVALRCVDWYYPV